MINKKANKLMLKKQNNKIKNPIRYKLYTNMKEIYITAAFKINKADIV